MYKIGILDDEFLIAGFKGIGFYTASVKQGDDIMEKIKDAIGAGCKIIMVSEDFVGPVFSLLDEISEREGVAISIIPGRAAGPGAKGGFLWKRLKTYTEKAIGSDVLGGEI